MAPKFENLGLYFRENQFALEVVKLITGSSNKAFTMDRQSLLDQNETFNGTMGVSIKNKSVGFVPAFRDDATGRVELARFRSGEIAPMHLIVGLPAEWALSFDADGAVASIKNTVIAGFVCEGKFFTRDEACAACSDL